MTTDPGYNYVINITTTIEIKWKEVIISIHEVPTTKIEQKAPIVKTLQQNSRF